MCKSVSEQCQSSSRESFKRVEGHSSLKLLKDGVSPRERPELALGKNPDQVSPDPGLGSNIHSSVSNGWTLQLGVVEGKGRNSVQVPNGGSGTDSLLTKQKLDEAKIDRTPTVADGLSDSQSSVVEVPSQTSEPIAIGDVNVMKASVAREGSLAESEVTSKPCGSAHITVTARIGQTTETVTVNICVDTGADMTLCTVAFLQDVFGDNYIKHIKKIRNPPQLRSATGHRLNVLGRINLVMMLGTYKLDLWAIVQEGAARIFLLGCDIFYNRLVFDRGKFIKFAKGNYPPIPIHYTLVTSKVKSGSIHQVAPRSSALIPVKISDDKLLHGKEVIVTSINRVVNEDEEQSWEEYSSSNLPIVDTVSTITNEGFALVMVENNTEDVLTILPDCEIGRVNLLNEEEGSEGEISVYYVEEATSGKNKIPGWPESVLTPEFVSRLPSNVQVRTENLSVAPDHVLKHNQAKPEGTVISEDGLVNYVHDKLERKQLLDGTGDGFPTPPAPEPLVDPGQKAEGPEAWLENIEHGHLKESQWEKLRGVLVKYRDAFSKSKTEIGCCTYFKAELPLKKGTGYLYNKPRPLPFKHKEVAVQTISDLLEQGIIRPSKSPHATNIVVVKKKALNGVTQHRVCVDLRQVNEHSVPNRFPNFQMEDAMAKIQGSVLRTSFDFANAFHQIMLQEDSIPVTAFYLNNVLYEYVRVPFGHVCAMNIFCCVMALLCEKYPASTYYADDLMVLTRKEEGKNDDETYDQHLEDISGMLARIIQAGLKLKAHKCQWCYGSDRPMDWLGFTLEDNLLKPQEAKVKAIKEFPTPSTSKQAISFVSTASFYRRFIKSFAKIAKPIYDAANAEEFCWSNLADKAMQELKDILCSDVVLRLPRQGEPFILYTDACHSALGVVLCQVDPADKLEHPCAYGSRKFNDSELKLSTPCKELLAIIYGLNLWSFYICGNPIHIYSDCRAWTFLKMQTGISGKISRLALLVAEYQITISYIPGAKNKAADGLSRAFDTGEACDDQTTAKHPALEDLKAPMLKEGQVMELTPYLDKCGEYISEVWPKLVKEYEERTQVETKEEGEYINNVLQTSPIFEEDKILADRWRELYGKRTLTSTQLGCGDSADSQCLTEENRPKSSIIPLTDDDFLSVKYNIRMITLNDGCFTMEAFKGAQMDDEICKEVIESLKSKQDKYKEKGYYLKLGLLMRQFTTKDGQTYDVVCVPKRLVKALLDSTHKYLQAGHHGSQRYLLDMSRKYYWKGMTRDIKEYHEKCYPCAINDKYPVKVQSGHVLVPKEPLHIVHYDIVTGLPKALDGSYAIILFYDGFTRFTFGIPLASEKAEYIVKKVMSHFVAAFGLPWALHSDNGKNVDGNLIRYLASMLGVVKTTTPPYTPRANPCETVCGAVAMLIRKALSDSDKRYWSQCLPFVLNALNSTVHTAHGYTPRSLMFGRPESESRSLVPLVPFHAESANVNEYYQKARKFQELAFQIARVRNEKRINARREAFDKTARKPKYKEGDYVLKKNLSPASGPGKMKLRAKYLGPYRVIKVYKSSLAIIPWTEGGELERYYKNPDLFKLVTRGKVQPFRVEIASMSQCKPYKGAEPDVEIISPFMLEKFLKKLKIDENIELKSIIVSDDDESDSDKSSKASSHVGSDPGSDPEDLDDPDEGGDGPEPPYSPDVTGGIGGDYPDMDDLPDLEDRTPPAGSQEDTEEDDLGDFEMSRETARTFRENLLDDDQLSNATSRARNRHQRLSDILKGMRNPDRNVRDAANRELDETFSDIMRSKRQDGAGQEYKGSPDRSSQSGSELSIPTSAGGIDDTLTWDYEGAGANLIPTNPIPAPRAEKKRVSSPPEVGIGRKAVRHQSTPIRKSRGTSAKRVRSWVAQSSPDFQVEDDQPLPEPRTSSRGRIIRPIPHREGYNMDQPQVTRYGRVSKPPEKYDPAAAEEDYRRRMKEASRYIDEEVEKTKATKSRFKQAEQELSDIEAEAATNRSRPSKNSPGHSSKSKTSPENSDQSQRSPISQGKDKNQKVESEKPKSYRSRKTEVREEEEEVKETPSKSSKKSTRSSKK